MTLLSKERYSFVLLLHKILSHQDAAGQRMPYQPNLQVVKLHNDTFLFATYHKERHPPICKYTFTQFSKKMDIGQDPHHKKVHTTISPKLSLVIFPLLVFLQKSWQFACYTPGFSNYKVIDPDPY